MVDHDMQSLIRGRFVKLSTIDPLESQPSIVLTLDIDWAHDAVLADTIDLVEAADIPATWFATHDTTLLARIRENPLFELGIHPNFNPLLHGPAQQSSNADEVISRLLDIVPDARCVRSHSAVIGSGLVDCFVRYGLTHSTNYFIPWCAGIEVRAWRHPAGLIEIPYVWTDDVYAMGSYGRDLPNIETMKGPVVLNFHPIHLFINTCKIEQYRSTRHMHRNPNLLRKERNTSCEGARDLLVKIVTCRGAGKDVK